jgi:hypothetical protein
MAMSVKVGLAWLGCGLLLCLFALELITAVRQGPGPALYRVITRSGLLTCGLE